MRLLWVLGMIFAYSGPATAANHCGEAGTLGKSGYFSNLHYAMTIISSAELCGETLPSDEEALMFAQKATLKHGCGPGTFLYDRLGGLNISFRTDDNVLMWGLNKSDEVKRENLVKIEGSIPDFCSHTADSLKRVRACIADEGDCDIASWPLSMNFNR